MINKYKNLINYIKQRTSVELERRKIELELKNKEKLYKDLANSTPQIIVEIDKQGNILFLNEQGIKNFNLINYKGENIFKFIDKEYIERFKDDINSLNKKSFINPCEYRFIKENDKSFPCILHMNKISKSIIRCFISDISKLRTTEIALKESEELYSLTLRGINDGFWDWNIEKNKIFFSPRWKEILGYDEDDNLDLNFWFSSIHKDDIDYFKNTLDYFINKTDLDKIELEYRIKNKSGNYIWVVCNINSIRDKNNKAKRIAGYHSDITIHKSKEQLLENLLYNVSHDSLTGLPNRNFFIEKLEKAFLLSKNKDEKLFAVLFIDINRFKIINDSLGHSAGDNFLVKVAERLKTLVNENVILSRLGGDDFAILLQNINDEDEAIIFSKKIIQIIQEPFIINEKEVFASVSIGISVSNRNHNYAEEMLRNADLAMYKAKKTGKNNFEIFNPKMHKTTFEILELETDLRNAIKRKEFALYYQPIISLISGKIIGFEALLRWYHSKKGLISSDKFIPIAEETGLIVPIGNWVIKKSCKQIKKWQEKFGNLSISVNLSTKQFYYDELVEDIIDILNITKIDPHSLKLEITESSIVENFDNVKEILLKLKELNIQIQIDDFGTGYSSLSYLHRFPVNTIKIDKSFINTINLDKEKLEIVKTIINLAKNLNMDVIAEGIENKEQLNILRSLDCNYGQGYFFSKPLSNDIIEELMLSNPKW
ncbi:MAG: diguanylate cyclase [Candidatus Sericytochromatia bacterium]|nr:MAG: diguanylate cyclase [Candidatus Sericytochromatia bacterium]